MNTDVMKNLIANETAREELQKAQSPEELSEALKKYGIECSAEELNDAITSMQSNGELSEDALDSVAGGFSVGAAIACGVLLWLGVGYVQGLIDGVKCDKKSKRK